MINKIWRWQGCSPIVAAAIDMFESRWGPYSTSSRRYYICNLWKELIDPAWANYLSSLPIEFHGRMSFEKIILGEEVHSKGFRHLRMLIKDITKSLNFNQSVDINFDGRLESYDFSEVGANYKKPFKDGFSQLSTVEIFEATIETLISLIDSCEGKAPKKTLYGKLNTQRAINPLCKFCGELTMLEAYISRHGSSQNQIENQLIDHDPIDELPNSLSARYCKDHQSKLNKEKWNAVHRTSHRQDKKFQEEVIRLKRQSCDLSKPLADSKNIYIDAFIFIVALDNTYRPLENDLYTDARNLVASKMNDRKKIIVMMLARGMKQNEVAAMLGLSKQVISKTLNSIPARYRYDNLTHSH